MIKKIILLSMLMVLVFCACSQPAKGIQEVTAQDLYEAVYKSNADLQLVDVRTAEEFGVSHLKDAQNICVTEDDFEAKVASLDREKPIFVYCKKGGRSARAAQILEEMGFKEIYDLQGGISAWETEGLETEN